jgi:hypothetical protein
MKFKISLKHIPEGGTVGRLENSGRIYPCLVCGAPTGWRDCTDPSIPGGPCCSDECLDVRDTARKEEEAEALKTAS